MSKLEETNSLIDYIIKLRESNLNVDDTAMLLDIAKSLAMIADKLCGSEREDKEELNGIEERAISQI